MSAFINGVIGARIIEVQKVYTNNVFDYWGIDTDKFTMSISNPVKFTDVHGISEWLDVSHLDSIRNCEITDVTGVDNQYVDFHLGNSGVISISLKNEDFTGPEAVELYFVTGEIIIFN